MFKSYTWSQWLTSLGTILILLYFTYHIFQGNYGVIALMHMEERVSKLEKELNGLQKEKTQLERNVKLLRPDSLDIDLLEERARNVLHFAYGNEVVIKTDTIGRQQNH